MCFPLRFRARRGGMTGARIAGPRVLAVARAVAALAVLPRAYEAQRRLSSQDDPVALADRAVARSLNSSVAERKINAALAANDADLAQSFVDLARDNHLPIDPALSERVRQASAEAGPVAPSMGSFGRGLFTG